MSTYSTRLKIELIGSGEQSNSWGNTTNNNFSQSIEQSIAGVYTKNLGSSSSPVTLTTNDGPQTQANNEARQAAIIFTGHSSDFIIQFPAVEKLYFLRNASSSNKITARLGSSGNTFVINPDRNVFLSTDGTNWFEIQTQGSDWLTKTGTYTAFAGDKIFANTTGGAFTITLPASPNVGDEVRFVDLANHFDTNNLTVGRNSEKIDGATSDLTVATEGAAFALVYSGSTYGWKLLEK
jgi:hypothetical protein|tara:strand:- start:3028 stop:3738 length:711 start_codon:yes stop_codon:yes gene_type:complete